MPGEAYENTNRLPRSVAELLLCRAERLLVLRSRLGEVGKGHDPPPEGLLCTVRGGLEAVGPRDPADLSHEVDQLLHVADEIAAGHDELGAPLAMSSFAAE